MYLATAALPGPFIDGHCHLAHPKLYPHLEAVLERSKKAGITRWLQGGIEPDDWSRQKEICKKYPMEIFPAFGLHPVWIAQQLDFHSEPQRFSEFLSQNIELLKTYLPEAIGIGELGLDFGPHCIVSSYPSQREAFKIQLQLALDYEKPLILHLVRSHGESLKMLRETGVSPAGGIVHSFNASYEIAKEYIRLGLKISVTGGITRNGFEKLKQAVIKLPLESLVIETDSPDQPPQEWRLKFGEVNEPASLIEIAESIANLRKDSKSNLLSASQENLRQIFRLS